MKSFPWRFAAYFLAGVYLFADLYACHGPLRRQLLSGPISDSAIGGGSIADVYGRPITVVELREALRAHLWRRGEQWGELSPEAQKQTRWLVAENLVNDRIIHAFRIMNGLNKVPENAVTGQEFEMWARQFEEAADRDSRLTWQRLGDGEMRSRVRSAKEDQAWIEERIARRLAEVTEAEARKWFDANRETLTIPPTFQAAHIYLTRHDRTKPEREPEIREIHRKLSTGEATFEVLAASFSDDERNKKLGGDLGWFTDQRMPEDFIAAVEKLQPGQTSAPVLTQLGWHIIRLIGRRPARIPEFDEVRTEILALLTSQRREAAVKTLIAELRARSIKPTRFVFYRPALIETALPAE